MITKQIYRVHGKPKSEPGVSYWFWCDGCRTNHSFRTKLAEGDSGPTWTFDGDMEEPTFSPSLLIRYWDEKKEKPGLNSLCHLFLRKGMVEYLSDCTHSLAGKTVPVETSP